MCGAPSTIGVARSRKCRSSINMIVGVCALGAHQVRIRVGELVAQLAELSAVLGELLRNLELEVRQRLPNVVHQDLRSSKRPYRQDDRRASATSLGALPKSVRGPHQVELARQKGCAAVLRLAGVGRVVLKELALMLQRGLDVLAAVNVPLAAVNDRDVSWQDRGWRSIGGALRKPENSRKTGILAAGQLPRRNGITRPARMSRTFVPSSMISILVSTPIVRWPRTVRVHIKKPRTRRALALQ